MGKKRQPRQQIGLPYATWVVVLVLLLVYGLMVSSALRKSAMVDEQSHLFRGVAYLQAGASHFLLGHPLFASSLSALPVLTEPELALPSGTPAWENGDWSVAGDAFMWRLGNPSQRILFLGRLPVMWLTLLLLALVYRWGKALAGPVVGLTAFLLLAFDPNLLANGRIISGDIPLTLFFVLTLYGYWRWAVKPVGWRPLLLAGLGLGLASVSKFNAGLLLPIVGLLGLYLAWRRRSWQPVLVLFGVGVVASLVIWAANGFALRPFPGGPFWEDLFWELEYFGKPHGSYLAGSYSTTGWWYYFPVAFALKTPLPTLLLLALAVVAFAVNKKGRNGLHTLFLLLPVAVYGGVSLTSSLNIGYRYLLPTLPFLWLFTAVSLNSLPDKWRPVRRWLPAAVMLWLMGHAVFIWPNYLPFFNVLAGGPDNEWRLLSDSNIDWGQDLPALAAWQAENGTAVKLSYFGTAHPSAYGVEFEPLPMWPPAPQQAVPGRQAYNPQNPAPGFYALSVTSLHGVVLGQQRDAFAWFRERTPVARLGGSIFVYEVAAVGEPVELVLAGVEPAQLAPEIQSQLVGNDWKVRWIDGRSALLWPENGGWLVLGEQNSGDHALDAFSHLPEPLVVAPGQTLYQLPALVLPEPDQEPHPFADVLALLDVQFVALPAESEPVVQLVTTWRAASKTNLPLKLFVHALDEGGEIVGQWDGLDVDPQSWVAGDTFVQLHRFSLPGNDLAMHFLIGVYDGQSLSRVGEPISFFPQP